MKEFVCIAPDGSLEIWKKERAIEKQKFSLGASRLSFAISTIKGFWVEIYHDQFTFTTEGPEDNGREILGKL